MPLPLSVVTLLFRCCCRVSHRDCRPHYLSNERARNFIIVGFRAQATTICCSDVLGSVRFGRRVCCCLVSCHEFPHTLQPRSGQA